MPVGEHGQQRCTTQDREVFLLRDAKELLGLELQPYSFPVEEGKIREFALAIGDPNPIYFDEEAARKEGFDGTPVPLTFLQVIDMWGGYTFDEKTKLLGLNPVKVLHGEQEYEFLGDIYAGDVLTVHGKVVDVQVKEGASGGMNFIKTENRYVNQNGTTVAVSRNTTIERH